MVAPNTPEGTPETPEKKKDTTRNIHSLIKDGIIREFWEPMSPKKFHAYRSKRTEFHDKIRIHMRDLRRENMEDWGDISDEIIDSFSKDEELWENIARASQNLLLMRKRTYNRALELFPDIKNQQADWSLSLQNWLGELDEDELKSHVTRTALMRKFVYKLFPELKNYDPAEKRDFDTIFHDKGTYFRDEDDKKRFSKIHHNYKKFNQVPDSDDLSFILWTYQAAPNTRKKQILSALWVSLTLKQAYELWLIGDKFLIGFSEQEMGDAYIKLDPDQKRAFIRSLAANNTYAISATDFEVDKISQIFENNWDRKALAEWVFRALSLDIPEEIPDETPDILRDIRLRKKNEAEAKWEEEWDYDIYEEFVEELGSKLKWADGLPHVKNIKLLKNEGAVIRFEHPENGIQYVRVKKVHDEDGNPIEVENGEKFWVELEWLSTVDGTIRKTENFSVSYDMFQDFLKDAKNPTVLKSEEFNNLLVTKESDAVDGKILDARRVEIDPVNTENIASKLDLLDPKGSWFWFESGTAFVAPATDTQWWNHQEEVWKVQKIYDDKVDLVDSSGGELEKWLPLADLYSLLASTPWFSRIAKIKNDEDMSDELKDFWLSSDGKLKDGKLSIKEKDDHGHEKEKEISCFVSEKGEHIRLEYMKNGLVRFGEFGESGEILQKIKKYAENKGIDKTVQSYYTWQTMSYPAFLKYLEKNKLKATAKDAIVKDAAHDLGHHDDHHHHPHLHGNLWKRILKWQNPASIWKGFEMLYHGIEHTLEKWAKLDAAKFALQTAKFLNLPEDVAAQVYSDVVSGSKEIIEKIESKIFGLPGPRGRNKCLHIVENTDSRPEEVGAAMSYMLKSYGHLYGEDMKHKQSLITNKEQCVNAPQGTFLFFDAMVTTSRIGNLQTWREKCYRKAIAEMGDENNHEGEPTEEQLIHALFKTVDGNWTDFPYAASVVKAMWGPSGFEKLWKFEWFENAKKKWIEQTQMVNAQWRVNKAVWYLKTHEFYKAIGAMEAVAGKSKEPEHQAVPFIWCVWGFSRYASHHALQQIKKYAESGYTFHGFAFMRQAQDNITYTDTVRLALKDIGDPSVVDKFDRIRKDLEFDPDNPKKTDDAAMEMMKFWQEWQWKGLHDMLQGHNGWLIKKYKDGNSTVKAYLGTLDGKHQMQLNDSNVPGNELGKDWFDEHGLRMNRIMTFDPSTGLYSLKRTLNKIQLVGTKTGDRYMKDVEYEKLWEGVKEQMEAIRSGESFGNDTELQKSQFLLYRREIIDFFIRQLNARSWEKKLEPEYIKNLTSTPQKYWDDLRRMGIDPYEIFDRQADESSTESDYRNWRTNQITGTKNMAKRDVPSVQNMVTQRSNRAITEKEVWAMWEPRPKGRPRMKRASWGDKSTWKDEDSRYWGWVADASDESGD
jgi:hypothetical protein